MIRITILSAALLSGEPARRGTVFRIRVSAGRSPGGIVEGARTRPARPFPKLSPR